MRRFDLITFAAVRAGVAVLVLLAIAPASADASARSRALTRQGYDNAYELSFAESAECFAEARRADAADPAPVRATAAVIWMEMLFAQGVATFDAFQGDASGDSVARPAVDPDRAARFLASATEAVRLAEQQVAAAPAGADALYQLGAGTALLALYRGTVEGRMWASFVEGRRSVRTMERVREHQNDHREALLVLGLYRYAVSTLSWPRRMLASAAGMAGDRSGGIELLEMAAASAADTSTDASLVLMIVYNREGRHADALRHLRVLRQRHPRNRLLALNAAATALAASDPAAAARTITSGWPTTSAFDAPRVLGERALWFYIRGRARVMTGDPGAADDLQESLASRPRDWIRARTHLEVARLALQTRDDRRARNELDAAERYGRQGGDRVTLEEAKELWRSRLMARQ